MKPPSTPHHHSRHILIAAVLAAMPASAANIPVADGPFQPTLESLKDYRCPDWFRDAKFGILAHWGPQAVPMDGDWYARKTKSPSSPWA